MDAVAFPPPPAPFLDDDLDFGDFTFASAPQPQPQPPTAAFDDDWGDFVASGLGSDAGASAPTDAPAAAPSSSPWEKPRGPLPLSLFGADADDDGQEEEEGPAGPPPMDTAPQCAPSVPSNGSRPADLKDLIAGLYGYQPPHTADAVPQVKAEEDDQGFGDDDWEFTAATGQPAADQDGGGPGHADGFGKIEDISKSLSTDQEDWSSFTSADGKLNHVRLTTDGLGNHESTGEFVRASTYSPANSSAILNLYKGSKRVDDVVIAQGSAESVQSSSDLFSNNEMNSSLETDDNHSSRSTSDCILIEFYQRLREESLTAISRHVKDLRKGSTISDENNKATAMGGDIQEIYDKLKDSSLPEGFFTEEQPWKDIYITELLNCIKEEHLKDFEQEYCLAEKIEGATEDTDIAVELYKLSISTLDLLKLASKEEQGDYVGAWYSMLLSCAQELKHGVALWQEFYHANVCDRVVSEGGHYFIALGEIYRVAQILYLSLQRFKPWVLADPGMLSKMLSCLDSCTYAWTSGLETALKMVIDSSHIDSSLAKALMESIKNITKLEVPNLQKNIPNNEMQCRLTLLPSSLLPGLNLVIWNGGHYFVKVANLWANRISPDPPLLPSNPTSSMNNAATHSQSC
ncbi:hypothetical protein ZEAMMB73_Zm00001d044696 [Zea mays]|uniref:Synergin gamma C-terminal domain-containing protein n=2 Tax=Zea mays TaxID=4577 RepID=A0A1D6NQS9_MAIZE|nr:hypothetical protein ZEAMMB73_Zm00001d044696 [Zea mays]